jgi:hypothetical protein
MKINCLNHRFEKITTPSVEATATPPQEGNCNTSEDGRNYDSSSPVEGWLRSRRGGYNNSINRYNDDFAMMRETIERRFLRAIEKTVGDISDSATNNGNIYWSPLGASYGSFVTADLPFELSLAIVDTVINFFKTKGTKEIFLIPPPLIYSKIYNQHLEYAMLFRKFDFEHHYISHSLDLAIDYKKHYNRATNIKFNKIKKSDLTIIQKNDFESFYQILLENKRKHNAIPTHSLEDLQKLNSLLPDKLKLFLAYHKDILIGGHLVFLANENVSLCFYNAMDYNYQKLFPAYALAEFVIDWSKENGYKWFDFGVSQDTTSENPMTPSLNLIQFKEHFNTRGIFRSTYHFTFH